MDIVRVVLKNLRFHPYKASQLYGCFLNFEISHVQNKKIRLNFPEKTMGRIVQLLTLHTHILDI